MKMTNNEFNSLCQRYTIAPELALENNMIIECLMDMQRVGVNDNAYDGYRNIIISILETEF